ncbi:similar to amino acid transporter [Plenodomus lingam JN3]|uniref:Similar to amino acid transporter n=1 Tax=Leptosphaeria maculans (strain JN3 / isolate v23.1.3 / race Av1-4-5-6-7-8) TaxID=985895 RepID=E5ADU7_LEPMJ|nr:similar to amino acid transporter [Plenodomus lingam JN3]CBY01386.1 similar to amino acid transporter [Plenodomus lingam JN3]
MSPYPTHYTGGNNTEMAPNTSEKPAVDSDYERGGVLTEDAVFGEVVGLLGTAGLMMKTQIGLGVLSIPAVFDTLGLIPGVIALLLIGGITLWSNYMVGIFKLKHPEVYGIDDVGQLLFGRIGKEFFAVVFVLLWVFIAGAGMLSVSIGLNAISMHGTCTAVFVVVAFIIGFGLASVSTLEKVGWLAWVGLAGIISSIFVLTVSVGVQDRPAEAPQFGPWESDFELFKKPRFSNAAAALASLVFAYAGTPAFFSIVSEMRDPRDYGKALAICQSVVTILYITIGIVVYYYCGSYVASPALGSAGVLMKRICYGLALPGLLVTVMLVTHISAKYVFVRVLRGSYHLSRNTVKHWVVWLSLTFTTALAAYVIASAIPVFNELVSLVGALLGTLMCFQPMGCMWLYDNWTAGKVTKTLRWRLMVVWSIFVIISGFFLMISGTYGSVVAIMDSYKENGGTRPWSCEDNSNSVPQS